MTTKPTVSTLNIFYMHVVFYYSGSLYRPGDTLVEAARQIESAFGPKPVGCYAFFEQHQHSRSDAASPTRSRRTVYGQSRDGVVGVTSLFEADAAAIASDALIECNRRGAFAKFVDFNWLVLLSHADLVPTARCDLVLTATVRMDLFRNRPLASIAPRKLAERLVDIGLQAGPCYCGFVDVASMMETGASCGYRAAGDLDFAPKCLARLIERCNWDRLREARSRYVRGVFWGNYLNADHLDRLGGKATFRDRYLTFARESLPGNQDLVTETADGGLFVRISNDPASCDATVQPIVGVRNAAWLRREFTAVDLLA